MLHAEFAEIYPRNQAWTPEFPINTPQQLHVAESYSLQYGQMLHDYLTDSPVSINLDELTTSYATWLATSYPSMTKEVNGLPVSESETLQQLLGFHAMNKAMTHMWFMSELEDDKQSKGVRRECIKYSAQNLAVSALHAIAIRREMASETRGYEYFGEKQQAFRALNEGRLAEIDAGIALLEASQSQPFDVLPAPPQFERGKHSNNVDFIALGRGDLYGKVVGVQVKSKVKNSDLAQYDGDHCVLVCAANDMDDVRAMRTEARSSSKSILSWNGQLAAEAITRLHISGRGKKAGADFAAASLRSLSYKEQRQILRLRAMARAGERGNKPHLKTVSQRIGSKVMKKLDS